MSNNHRSLVIMSFTMLGLGALIGDVADFGNVAEAQSSNRVFELRTYTANAGRLEELHARFAYHTVRVFERHGMTNIGYFTPREAPLSESTLIYLLAHDSREAADASWAAFRADPQWQRAAEESRRNGRLVASVESVFLDPTDFSRMR